MTAREALLQAFDRLFDVAAQKLNVVCTPEERAEAKEQFARHFESPLAMAQRIEIPELPEARWRTASSSCRRRSWRG